MGGGGYLRWSRITVVYGWSLNLMRIRIIERIVLFERVKLNQQNRPIRAQRPALTVVDYKRASPKLHQLSVRKWRLRSYARLGGDKKS